jgi:outer membrane protein TolC
MLCTGKCWSQAPLDSVYVLPDSAYAFTIENFYAIIMQHHPVVKQVDLLGEVARQEVRLARGSFDPKIEASLVKKNFNGVEYYNASNAELKFPTLFPIDPKVGIDRNKGEYLNPERYIGDTYDYRQLYAGISLPLGRGLFTDERRTALRQAQLFTQFTEAEQIKQLNKLLLDAAKDYWQWYYAYYNFRLYHRSVRIAKDVFNRTKINCEYGELAPIDTIQAKLTLQQRQIEQQEAWMEFQNTGTQISNYLWDSLSNPLMLSLRWAPVDEQNTSALGTSTLNELMDRAQENHPELQKIRIKLQQLDYDRRLAIENLKPGLNLNYSLINQPVNPEWNFVTPTGDDYKFGLDFSFPIFLRKERAKFAFARIKISNTEYEERITNLRIKNDIQFAYNTLTNNQNILQQQQAMADNYNTLLRAELLNVENGESDLFKWNVQQEKLLQAQSKVLKLKTEVEKQKALLYWAAGIRRF